MKTLFSFCNYLYELKFLFSLFVLVSIPIYSYYVLEDISVFPIFLILTFISLVIVVSVFNDKNVLGIFIFTLSTYLSFTLITDYLYVENPFTDYFYVPDSLRFYERIYYQGFFNFYPNESVFDFTSFNNLTHGGGFYYISWLISRLSYFFGGENSLLIHKISTVFFACFFNVFLYLILKLFYDFKKSKFFTIFFTIFSFNLIFSATLLRDMHVALFIIIAIYFFIKKRSILNTVVIFLCGLITFTLRPTHIVFFLFLFIGVFFFKANKFDRYYSSIGLAIVFVSIIVFSNLLLNIFDSFYILSNFYSEYSITRVENFSGITGILANILPGPLFTFLRIPQTLINPFLFSEPYSVIVNGSQNFQLLTIINNLISFVLCIQTIITLHLITIKRIRKSIPKKLIFLLISFLLFLGITAIFSIDLRRLLGFLPLLFIVSIMCLEQLSLKLKKRYINLNLFTFIIVALTHLAIKL